MKAIVITGVSRGLGKAFFDILKDKHYYLICISRSFTNYQNKLAESDDIDLIRFDLSGTNSLVLDLNLNSMLGKYEIDELVFINNAGTISPIGNVGFINDNEIRTSINVNIVSPILITNSLLLFCVENNIMFKVLNVSTRIINKSVKGLSIYSSVKIATKMFFDVVARESDVSVKTVYPGAMDTDMQKEIRNINEKDLPLVNYFRDLKRNNELKIPSQVAFDVLYDNGLI